MLTIHEVSRLAGVSIRTLQYYDSIGLLRPSGYSDAGYRQYDDAALETLQQILLFKELAFPLKEIKTIIQDPCFDTAQALEQQIALMTLKKEHLENLIRFARELQTTGVKTMDFSAFDAKKLEEYAARAKAQWGRTPEYKESEEKNKDRTLGRHQMLAGEMMGIFAQIGALQDKAPDAPDVQLLIRKLQDFITAHYYHCTNNILADLGRMYGCGGEFTQNINKAAGEGAAEFAAKAIEVYCR